tara:strand:- start:941 stop:1045 length:105 start_codon:yes stop_codon:yes gene_type:complete
MVASFVACPKLKIDNQRLSGLDKFKEKIAYYLCK